MSASLSLMAIFNCCEWGKDAWLVNIVLDLSNDFDFSNKTDFRI